jgi:hypothetical protein
MTMSDTDIMYGVFEDGDLITGAFADRGHAEDEKDAMRVDAEGSGNERILEVEQICQDHDSQPVYGCVICRDETAGLQRFLTALKANADV